MGKASPLARLGRLFVIKTRWEAWAVTWAIALGAVERGNHYLAIYPGTLGWVFFATCCCVTFVAGAKLLDAVRPAPVVPATGRTRSVPLRRPERLRPRQSRPVVTPPHRQRRH